MNFFLRAALCAAAIVLVGCAADSRIEQEPPATLVEFKPEQEVRELWTADVGSLSGKYDARLVPVLDGKMIYVANAEGLVQALAADTGRVQWENNIEAPITGAIGVGDGLVVVGTRKGEVIALNAADGTQRWPDKAKPDEKIKVSSEVQAPAAISRGIVVVQAVDGRITGLNASDGKRAWFFDRSEPALSLRGTSTPIIAADFVLSGFANGKIVALQLKDGKLLWEHTVAQPRGRNEIERLVDVDAPLLLWGDTLFAVAYQGKVIAIDMRSGRPLWTREISSYVGMDANRSAVYVADEMGQITAFDQRGGASLWKQEKLRGRVLSAPVLHDNAVIVGDFEGYLHWVAHDDGHFIARYRIGSAPVRIRGIVEGPTLYVVAQNGRLAALQLTPLR